VDQVLIPISTILQLPTEIKFCAIFEQLQMETHFLNTFQWITKSKTIEKSLAQLQMETHFLNTFQWITKSKTIEKSLANLFDI